LVHERFELPEEVIDDRGRTHEKTASGPMTLVHEIDYKDGHVIILSRS
jgi:hypothetical protein